jgi:hypothetical protein
MRGLRRFAGFPVQNRVQVPLAHGCAPLLFGCPQSLPSSCATPTLAPQNTVMLTCSAPRAASDRSVDELRVCRVAIWRPDDTDVYGLPGAAPA